MKLQRKKQINLSGRKNDFLINFPIRIALLTLKPLWHVIMFCSFSCFIEMKAIYTSDRVFRLPKRWPSGWCWASISLGSFAWPPFDRPPLHLTASGEDYEWRPKTDYGHLVVLGTRTSLTWLNFVVVVWFKALADFRNSHYLRTQFDL